MKILIHWLISALAIVISAYLLPGVHVSGFITALVVAVVLGAVNGFLRPILVLLTLPITILTLGIFLLVLNTLLIMLVASIVPGFVIDGFWWAFIFGIVLALVNTVLNSAAKDKTAKA
jgi:putative membrane protein